MAKGKGNELIYQDEFQVILKCSNCDDEFIISSECLDDVKIRSWSKSNNTGYIRAMIDHKDILLHRYLKREELAKEENKDKIVDHINRNKLDNRLENLRLVTTRTNCINSSNSYYSKINLNGVQQIASNNYVSSININGQTVYLGSFEDKYDAALVYDSYIYHNCPYNDYQASNLYNNNIPQEILDKYSIKPDDPSTIPFIPTFKQGNNNYRDVFFNNRFNRWGIMIVNEDGNRREIKGGNSEIESAAIKEQWILDHPGVYPDKNKSNIIWKDESDGLINIAGVILTKDEMEEKKRGY